MQIGFDSPYWGTRNNPNLEKNVKKILEHWRKQSLPVIHIKHCSTEEASSLREDNAGNEFKAECKPLENEIIFKKSVNSAFIGTSLEQHLKENNFHKLTIVGLTTDHCISTTTRMAGNLGFDVTLISDATATFDRAGPNNTHYSADEIHNIHLASLDREFCEVVTTQELIKL